MKQNTTLKDNKKGLPFQPKKAFRSNPSVMGSSNTNVPLYPSLEKRGNLPARSRFGEGRGEILPA